MLDDAQFQRNLARALGDMKEKAVKGIRLSSAFVKLEAQKKVPVDEGNLKASAYVSVSVGKYGVVAEIGFTAHYAIYVHEAEMTLKGQPRRGENAKGFYWDPQATATNKFLQKAFYENTDNIFEIMQRSVSL